ncbi:ferric reductase-like transmembrane domain-containing protein [Amycolatopsis sp. NPDC102389]|uniref:ferric reductase-like transmembrane domain-containing protein n=1 Tax=Amycolatopsis sp. NPDC102389 TaxID=3363941 RepID=UPI0037F36493
MYDQWSEVVIVLTQKADTDPGIKGMAQTSARISYGFMCLTLCWGVLTATGWIKSLTGRKALRNSHMVLGVLTLSFGVVHAMSFLFLPDGFTLAQISIPLLPGTLARHELGVLGLEVMIAVALTGGISRFSSYRRFLWIHRLAYPAVAITALHSFFGAMANGHLGLLWFGGITLMVPVVLLTALRFTPTRYLERLGLVEELV